MNTQSKLAVLSFTQLVILLCSITMQVHGNTFSERADVQEFIALMAQKHQFSTQELNNTFTKIEPSNDVIKQISKPFESVSWDRYQKHFITQKRIQQGVQFWKKHEAVIKKAEEQYGIPGNLLVAIIGVESFYGQYSGTYPVLQALSTLAFDYPPRQAFFKKELEAFLLLAKKNNLNLLNTKGSYAGAMGAPQFIASSYQNYAVDFDNSGNIDLVNNINQAIGSVANYFKSHGWQTGQPVTNKASIQGHKYKQLLTADRKNPKPTLSLSKLNQHGVESNATLPKNIGLASFLELDNGGKKEYWLGYQNFYVITRYNHSTNYAMAVYQLSQELLARYQAQATKAS